MIFKHFIHQNITIIVMGNCDAKCSHWKMHLNNCQVVIKTIYYHLSENEKKIHKINNNLQ